MAADSHLDPELTRDRNTVPAISDDFCNYMKLLAKTEPEIMSTLLPILRTKPDSGIQLVNTKFTNYATWRKNQSRREKITLEEEYAVLRYDEDHDIAWAVIAAKVLSAAKHRPERIFIDYSAQYILDFARRPGKAKRKHQRTCCKRLTVVEGLEYGLKNNLPREQDWKYAGCRDIRKPTSIPLFRMGGDLRLTKEPSPALSNLRMVPVAAQLHVFEPDIDRIVGDEIYRGPTYFESKYVGLRDLSTWDLEMS